MISEPFFSSKMQFSILAAFLFLLLGACSEALKQDLTLFKDERDIIVIESFGFKDDGIAKIELEYLKVCHSLFLFWMPVLYSLFFTTIPQVSHEKHASDDLKLGFVLKKTNNLNELKEELEDLKRKSLCLFDESNLEGFFFLLICY